MTDLVYDLVLFARWMLVPGGRLVFFLPTVTEDWDDLDVPIVQGMKEIKFCSGSSQDFGRWSRRVSLHDLNRSSARKFVDLTCLGLIAADHDGKDRQRDLSSTRLFTGRDGKSTGAS
jgi:hypothetical protein